MVCAATQIRQPTRDRNDITDLAERRPRCRDGDEGSNRLESKGGKEELPHDIRRVEGTNGAKGKQFSRIIPCFFCLLVRKPTSCHQEDLIA